MVIEQSAYQQLGLRRCQLHRVCKFSEYNVYVGKAKIGNLSGWCRISFRKIGAVGPPTGVCDNGTGELLKIKFKKISKYLYSPLGVYLYLIYILRDSLNYCVQFFGRGMVKINVGSG